MMTIEYTIEFHTDWHCGSGLAAGADVDALVIKDKDGLPYVPGKTIKGLVREAVIELRAMTSKNVEEGNIVRKIAIKEDDLLFQSLGYFDNKDKKIQGMSFFTNAEISDIERKAIVENKAADYLYRSIASTALDEDGIAKEHSLRKMEVTIPCQVHGKIIDIPYGFEGEIKDALRYIKRLGQNRNRGFGRCTIHVK